MIVLLVDRVQCGFDSIIYIVYTVYMSGWHETPTYRDGGIHSFRHCSNYNNMFLI